MSYQHVWGAFREHLEANPPQKPTQLVQLTGQMCRAGLYDVKDKISLEKMGLGDQVSVTGLKLFSGGPTMFAYIWSGLVAIDILRQLYIYHLSVESRPGEAEEIYQQSAEALLRIPPTQSLGSLRGKFHDYRGSQVLCTYHPAYLLRNPPAKKPTWEDLQLLMKAMGIKIPKRK